jgi:NAD(P)-dependent dehydrogenase (short-subunit alcohol dehydrogenase family)
VQGGVADLGNRDRLYEMVGKEQDGLDIVVASARVVERRLTASVTPEHFDKTFNVNARAPSRRRPRSAASAGR